MSPSSPPAPENLSEKALQTRSRIRDTALALIRDEGYEATTMRKVAEAAEVSLGNAYYYFPSKAHLVQDFYARSHAEHLEVAEPLLERETTLEGRLLGVLRTKLDTARPDHPFGAVLFKTAADPASPLSPFSPESAPTRREATLLAKTLEGTGVDIPEELADELPTLLWLYEMGIILFWLHDTSPGQERSHRLLEGSGRFVCTAIRLAGVPFLRPLTRQVASLLRELRSPGGPA